MPDEQLARIEHIVVLMLENRSFDHMLGFLYTDEGNVSPAGDPYAIIRNPSHQPGCRISEARREPQDSRCLEE